MKETLNNPIQDGNSTKWSLYHLMFLIAIIVALGTYTVVHYELVFMLEARV